MEDISVGHIWVGLICIFGRLWHVIHQALGWVASLPSSGNGGGLPELQPRRLEAWIELSSLPPSSGSNNPTRLSLEFLRAPPMRVFRRPRACTFLVRDQRLVPTPVRPWPTAWVKYLMRSPTGFEIIFVVNHARFLGLPPAPGSSLCVGPKWAFSLEQLQQNAFSPGKCAGRLNTDPRSETPPSTPCGIIHRAPKLVNFVNVQQWLSATQFILASSFLVGHLWHCGPRPAPQPRPVSRKGSTAGEPPAMPDLD